jgi:DNA-binding transcriptional LysR family regulator
MAWQWDDVRFFLAVARAGSLSGAARALGVGHVTVGRRITLLDRPSIIRDQIAQPVLTRGARPRLYCRQRFAP